MEIINSDIHSLKELYSSKKASISEVVEAFIQRIQETNSSLSSFNHLFFDNARKEATLLDQNPSLKEGAPLRGIPIAIKDNICMANHPVTCGSKILDGFTSPFDGGAVAKLKEAGAIIVGSCAMDEFAMGSSCETNCYHSVKNPYDLEKVPGGSSGGSAVAVASNQVVASLGSDTGGSIRQPASFCGVVGMKPTYGLVSRFGLVAFASSLDQIGPIARNVSDSALILEAIAGHDKRDSTSLKDSGDTNYLKDIKKKIEGKKIGLPKEYFQVDGINDEVKEALLRSKDIFEKELGATVCEISLPHTSYATSAYYILATAEASANLSRFDGVRYGRRAKEAETLEDLYVMSRSQGFGSEVKRRIITGTFVLSSGYYDAYYLKGQKVRTLIIEDFKNAFKEVDVIMTPTSPQTAFKLGEKMNDPISMYLSDIFTVSVNLAGVPAMSLPCGFDQNDMPIGMQLIAPILHENVLFNVGHQFENVVEIPKKTLKV